MNRMESQHLRSLSNVSHIAPITDHSLQTPVTYQTPDFSQYQNTVEFGRDTLRTWVEPYAPIEDVYRGAVGGVMKGYGYVLENYAPELFSPGSMNEYIKEINIMPTQKDWVGHITSPIPVVGTVQSWHTKSQWIQDIPAFQGYNDIGLISPEVPTYQFPSTVDPGTYTVSPETIHVPTYEPIDMPIYEPIDIPMPVYQPPAIPNF